MNKTEKTPKNELYHIIRGGSADQPADCRLNGPRRRLGAWPGFRSPVHGFRLVEVLDEQD